MFTFHKNQLFIYIFCLHLLSLFTFTKVSASETTKQKDQTSNANGGSDSKNEELYEHFTKKPSLILPFIEQPQVKDNQPQKVRIPKEQFSDFRGRSTKQPPTSTQNLVNYLENRRSTVSVDR